MSYVSQQLSGKFEDLSIDLKNAILERGVHLETMQDLIDVLEEICREQDNRTTE